MHWRSRISEQRKSIISADQVGALAQIMRKLHLVWRLLKDSRVPLFPKLFIPAAIIYIVSPIDLVPDFILGLGQLDDIAIFFLSIALFIEFCPRAIVDEHRRAIDLSKTSPSEEGVVEGSFRVMKDEE